MTESSSRLYGRLGATVGSGRVGVFGPFRTVVEVKSDAGTFFEVRDLADKVWHRSGTEKGAVDFLERNREQQVVEPVHVLEITDKMRDLFSSEGQPLFQTAPADEAMQAIKREDTGKLATAAQYARDGSLITFENLEAYGLFTQFVEEASDADVDYFGLTLHGETLQAMKDGISSFREKATESGLYSELELDAIMKLESEFNAAVGTNERAVVRLILDKNAVPEESFHEQSILQAASTTLAEQNTETWAKNIDQHPLFKKALEGAFGEDYNESSEAVRRHEFIAKLATGQYEYLNLDPETDREAAVDLVISWAEDYDAKTRV